MRSVSVAKQKLAVGSGRSVGERRQKPGGLRTRQRPYAWRVLALPLIVAAAVTSCSLSVPTPGSSVAIGQAIVDLETAVLQMREDNALLQSQIDSLRGVTAYQDTILRQLAVLNNVSVRPSSASFP